MHRSWQSAPCGKSGTCDCECGRKLERPVCWRAAKQRSREAISMFAGRGAGLALGSSTNTQRAALRPMRLGRLAPSVASPPLNTRLTDTQSPRQPERRPPSSHAWSTLFVIFPCPPNFYHHPTPTTPGTGAALLRGKPGQVK